MPLFRLSTMVALLAVLATLGAHDNPIDLSSSDPCALVKCTTRKIIDGKGLCVPTKGDVCGKVVCGAGLACYNSSCVKPGAGLIQN